MMREFNNQGHAACSFVNSIIQDDSTIFITYNEWKSLEQLHGCVCSIFSHVCRLYKVYMPTQDPRATSVEKISMALSLVHDSLQDPITKNHRTMYDVGVSKINVIGGNTYDVYIYGNSPNPNSYSLWITVLSSSTPLSLAISSVSRRTEFLCIQ